ncbi:N-acetylglucosamine-6-phosphate deacetylase [Pontibacillus marinus]|uniref:N-acetylglucosamine-6-phosphate deacetylase n=1 Tax=Pontibacillus marinus BH030004 = DSM 16465 TaxID=1385511 RepID=A0A0A5FUW9_9BACI|nr:N-acetylglucosamine-6-phosphate deacetylase [Pontibacillus marinus]KGX84556.1 hypothetical protein N783_16595 [Pontibacillus marinus BH030004 = DSM 16465]
MSNILLKNAKIHTGEESIDKASIWITDEFINEIGDNEAFQNILFDRVIDCEDQGWVLPGMIDLHIHGTNNADIMDGTQEALETMSKALPKEGTTSYLATTLTHAEGTIENALKNVRDFMLTSNSNGAEVIGVHLEGPFLNIEKRGAQLEEYIQKPNIELFNKWFQLSGKSIQLVTMAPEEDENYKLVNHLKELGIIVSIGHTNCTYNQARESINNGITHATHLFNGMSGIHHRDVGTAGAALLSNQVFAEMILDGYHLTPEIADLTYRLKGPDHIILVTDSIRAKFLDEGSYDIGGQVVTVIDNKVINEEGKLSGSVLKMSKARKNFMKWIDNDISIVTKITSTNPAKHIGVYGRKGSLHTGKDADIILVNHEGEIILTICRGKIVYDAIQKIR